MICKNPPLRTEALNSESCLCPKAAWRICLKWRPLLALERQPCFTWSRQEETNLLCIVWLQCSFGIKHFFASSVCPGQIHLCLVAQLYHSAGFLVFKAWNSLLPSLQKFVLSLSKYLPTFCHMQDHEENTKMNQTWSRSTNFSSRWLGAGKGRSLPWSPKNNPRCCGYLERGGDWLGGWAVGCPLVVTFELSLKGQG